MKLVELSKEERKNIYNKHMLNDFHKSEVKPLDMLERLIKEGHYICYGFFKDERLLGYAYFIKIKDSILMDYLAVIPKYRSMGYGSRFLQIIEHTFEEKYTSLLAEVENPRFALNKEDKLNRERRILFYLKNGFEVSKIETCVLEDQYLIIKLNLDKKLDDEEVYKKTELVYKTIFGEEYCKKNISISVLRN